MPTEADPIVETWYENQEESQQFKVVALDEIAGMVEIQHVDGDIEEVDLETWYLLDIEPIEDPEVWKGALGDYEEGNPDNTEDDTDDDWTSSSQLIEPSSRASTSPSQDSPLGGWDEELLDDDSWGDED